MTPHNHPNPISLLHLIITIFLFFFFWGNAYTEPYNPILCYIPGDKSTFIRSHSPSSFQSAYIYRYYFTLYKYIVMCTKIHIYAWAISIFWSSRRHTVAILWNIEHVIESSSEKKNHTVMSQFNMNCFQTYKMLRALLSELTKPHIGHNKNKICQSYVVYYN